ncbi:MAG: phosphate starvation-inducible protein PsiF [Gammaproteobacteria bacterium]|nr:MAG: phosphate starvation-inducible protein PsiF [Gammaproteobacteria bacterium]
MKIITALAAVAILGCGAAYAADQPAAPSATPVKKMSLKACNKQAEEKKLTGKERSAFVKDCRAGKSAG